MFQLLKSWLGRTNAGGVNLRVETQKESNAPVINKMVARNLVERNGRGKNGIQGKVTYKSTGAMNIDYYSASDVNIGDIDSIARLLGGAYKAPVEMRHSIDQHGHNVLNLSAVKDQRTLAVITVLKSNTTEAGGSDNFKRKSKRFLIAFRRLGY